MRTSKITRSEMSRMQQEYEDILYREWADMQEEAEEECLIECEDCDMCQSDCNKKRAIDY
jgi:heterodisulfide reductase subunit C